MMKVTSKSQPAEIKIIFSKGSFEIINNKVKQRIPYSSIIKTTKKENRYIVYLSSELPDFIIIKADSLSDEAEEKLNSIPSN